MNQPPLKNTTRASCPHCCAVPGVAHKKDCPGVELGISLDQALSTIGKMQAGYRPGDDGWTLGDTVAYEAAIARRAAPPRVSYLFESGGGDYMAGDSNNRRCAVISYEPHADDFAIDLFASAMKAKMHLTRAQGRGGWHNPAECPADHLREMLAQCVKKGDPIDVGNFAMMLHARRESTTMSGGLVELGPLVQTPPAKLGIVQRFNSWRAGNKARRAERARARGMAEYAEGYQEGTDCLTHGITLQTVRNNARFGGTSEYCNGMLAACDDWESRNPAAFEPNIGPRHE